jgi:hypothetical protein
MTDLDWPPPPPPDVTALERKPKVCRRHVWVHHGGPGVEPVWDGRTVCLRCGRERDETRARRGKSSRRLGGDTERRIEKVYGPVKIGERGDPVDHLGRVWRWQSKATRALPPKWLAPIALPAPRTSIPKPLNDAWLRMDGHYTDRAPLVIRSFVSRGIRSRDWIFVWWRDARDQLGLEPIGGAWWWVIPGDWWLDNFGLDS